MASNAEIVSILMTPSCDKNCYNIYVIDLPVYYKILIQIFNKYYQFQSQYADLVGIKTQTISLCFPGRLKKKQERTSMAWCKTAVSPLPTHWRYCSLAPIHPHNPYRTVSHGLYISCTVVQNTGWPLLGLLSWYPLIFGNHCNYTLHYVEALLIFDMCRPATP